MCAIFQCLENYKDLLIDLPDEIRFKDNTDSNLEDEVADDQPDTFNDHIYTWIVKNRCSTLKVVYENLPSCFTKYLNETNYTDYNTILFERFLDIEPIITVEYFYIYIGYIFNINYSIKNIFSKLLNQNSTIENKSD